MGNPHEYPKMPQVGVGGVIIWNDRVVLVKRKYNPNAGQWSIPGGHLKVGETLEQGILRECREETGLRLKVKGLADVLELIERDPDGRVKYHYVLIDYFLEPDKFYDAENPPEPRAMDDALDARLVRFSDLSKYELTDTVTSLFRKIGLLKDGGNEK